jgi:pyruvate/oxaloacetate carboxyltransferase
MINPVNKRHLDKLEKYVYEKICEDGLDVVQLFERLNVYANLKSISQYAKDNKLSYNGVKKHRKIIKLFGCKFVADND